MGSNRNVLIFLVFVLLIGGAVGVYRVLSIPPPEPASEGPQLPDPPAPIRSPAPQPASGREAVTTPAPDGDDAIAAGRVRGQIEVAPGEDFPAQFELSVDAPPGPTRVFSFTAADRLVTLDLSQGRSVLRARAEGLASRALVLTRDADSAIPPFRIVLEPAGRLGGQVLDARGAPIAGLPVSLVAGNQPDVRTVPSDGEGRYSFTDVPVGAYRVAFGAPDSPIAPVVPVEVKRSEVRDVPPQNMPELGEAEVRVLDRSEAPVEGARVFGAGQRGGWIDELSDANGFVRARFLPAGTFFLNVATESGRTGQGPLEINIGRIGRAVIHIRD